jgi:hypothetical protein
VNKHRKILRSLFLGITFLFSASILLSCVESLSESTTSSSTPSITINSPVTGDTVYLGKNTINYSAADGSGGSGLSYYEVYLNGTYLKKVTQNSDGTNPKITLDIPGSLLHTKIKYYLMVYNSSGKNKISKVQENIYVMDSLPHVPTNLVVNKINDNTAKLYWNADSCTNETGFELWRRDLGSNVDIAYRKIATFKQDYVTTEDYGLSPFVTYYYVVRAFNESGYSAFSNEVNTSEATGGPWNLKAEAIGASSVRLQWADFITNEQGFIIERTNPSTSVYETLTVVDANVTEYYDNTVKANTGYSYRIAYFYQQSHSPYSNAVSVTTFSKDYPAPTNLSGIYYPGQGVQLSWTDNNKNVQLGTIIERKGGTDDFIEIGTVSASLSSFLDNSIEPGTRYIYRVRQKLSTNTFTPYSNTFIVDIPN